jgi:hypothetical protein
LRLSTFLLIAALVFCVTTARAESKTMTMVVDGKPIITITVTEDTITGGQEPKPTEEEPDCE